MSQPAISVTLLHTNDMHGHLEAMSRLSTYARNLRRELESQGRKVFFFDAGDAADRRIGFIGLTKGAAFPRILSAMDYDLQSLGNAISITYGPQAAAEMAARTNFPVLAANFFDHGRPIVNGFQATAVFPLNTCLRLGVIGLTVDAPRVYKLFGLETPGFREAAQPYLDQFSRDGVAPVVVLSHLGLREDRLLAEAFPAIDVVIGGHTHELLENGEQINGVLIAQAGNYAEHLGRVDLEIDSDTGKVVQKSATVLPIPADTPVDLAVEAAIRLAETEADELLSRPIAELQTALDLDHFHECAVANLGADALCEHMQAEITLLSSGLFHRGLPAGVVTFGDLNAACFTTANPQLSGISGAQILAGLERALDPEFMHLKIKAFRGTPIGMPAVSGMRIETDPYGGAGRRVKSVWINDRPLDPQRIYRVAHTDTEVISEDYEFGFLKIEDDQVIRVDVPTILREAIEPYLQRHSPVPSPLMGRWNEIR